MAQDVPTPPAAPKKALPEGLPATKGPSEYERAARGETDELGRRASAKVQASASQDVQRAYDGYRTPGMPNKRVQAARAARSVSGRRR